MLRLKRSRCGAGSCVLVAAMALTLPILASAHLGWAQALTNGGTIAGTVTDPQGAPVAGAQVTIVSKATAEITNLTTSASGVYTSPALSPGNYLVRIEAKGFMPAQLNVAVKANTAADGGAKLTVVENVHVIDLPLNGRNSLDLTQLEPESQIQDGGNFDPTKNASTALAIDSRFGRATRTELDGVDISDETVGSTTQNVSLSAIQEPVVQQSAPNLPTVLASTGLVSLSTKSGTDSLHGEGFYNFRDQQFDAALPAGFKKHFQRNQFGASVGGAAIKDKLFFFLNAEHNKQDLIAPAVGGGDFAGLTSSYSSPLRETQGVGRLDYQLDKYRVFYRFSYDENRSVFPFIANSFQPIKNDSNSRDHAVGVDFSRGNYTHSIRLGYLQYHDGITDAVAGSSIFNPAPGIELAIGADPNCLTAGLDDFCSGSSYLAPQTTLQSNLQLRYDGSRPLGNHVFHFGAAYTRVHGGGFAEFLGTAPAVGSTSLSPLIQPPCVRAGNCPDPAGGAFDPLNYPALSVNLGNGQRFSSEKSAFGYSGGGLGPDNRITWYVGDSFKAKPNVTLTLGLNYVHDTGRTDSDLGPVSALNQFTVSNNQFFSYVGLGNRVRQPSLNLAPQFGFAWDSGGQGKTIIRGGIGLFYENSIWNNVLFDRAGRLAQGEFLGFTSVCSGGAPQTLPFATAINPSAICGQPIGAVTSQIAQLQQQYQAATAAAGPSANGNFIGNALASGINITGTQMLAPDFRTPRSVHINIGFEHELRPGSVISVEYVRDITTHDLLSIDTNHVGDFRFFDANAALAAINATVGPACGGGTVTAGSSIGAVQCFISANPAATISAFAANGLDSGYSVCGGHPCGLNGRPAAAFPGINSSVGANQMLFSIGRSRYQAAQVSWKADVTNPFLGVNHAVLRASYTYSRYDSTSRDSDLFNYAQDNASPQRFFGPNGLDRAHQLSFGTVADLPVGFHLSMIGHFDSPLPLSVTVPVSGLPGGIYQTDLTGDGTGGGTVASNGGLGDLLPGTNVGGYGRSRSFTGLNQAINNYNHNFVGTLTPAGQTLLGSGLFNQTELTELQAVIGGNQNGSGAITQLPVAPVGGVGQAWLKSFDVGLNWVYKFREKIEIRPGVSVFNVLNIGNFEGPGAPFTSVLNGQPGSANGTLSRQPNALRIGLGSSVNAAGAPRAVQFELKVKF